MDKLVFALDISGVFMDKENVFMLVGLFMTGKCIVDYGDVLLRQSFGPVAGRSNENRHKVLDWPNK